jgi:hypothetical protein
MHTMTVITSDAGTHCMPKEYVRLRSVSSTPWQSVNATKNVGSGQSNSFSIAMTPPRLAPKPTKDSIKYSTFLRTHIATHLHDELRSASAREQALV